jgi:tetratricopeptide (TPR) repeat protein
MKGITYRTGLVLFGVLLLFIGCAPSESYKLGQDLANERRWEEAAVYFEKALSENPGSQEYKDALTKANQEAAKSVYEKARQSLAASSDQNLSRLEQVGASAEKARRLDPLNQTIASFATSLAGRITGLKDKLKTLYTQADADMQKEDWPAAADKLKQINKIYPSYEDTGARLAKVEQEGAKSLYQQGMALRKQEDWKLAVQTYKKLMEINPNYYDAAKLYQEAQDKDNIQYYIAEGENAGRNQNWDRAIMMLEKASEYQPDNEDLRKKIESMKTKVGQIYFSEAVKLTNQGILFKAMSILDSARNYTPALQSDPAYRDFIGKFCAKLMERSDKYVEKELWGNAYIWLQKAEMFNPSYPNLFQKLLDARDNINKRIKKSIAVFDFGSPGNNKDAGKIAANKLIAYLHKNASGDLRIIERENLQSILREMQLGQTGLVDIKTAQSMGKMRGIDTFIMGDVLQYSTTYADSPSIGQAKVLVNEEDAPNPEFSDWRMLNPKPSKEELAAAPPRTIRKPTYQFISYKRGVAKVTAMIEVSYKLVDTTTGENIFTNTTAGKSIKEDAYQDGVALANIPHDALTLPSELEVIDELTNTKISEVGQSVLKQYQSLEVEYFNQAQQQEKRRNYEQAVEKYTDAMFDEKLKSISTPISQQSQESINRLIQDK